MIIHKNKNSIRFEKGLDQDNLKGYDIVIQEVSTPVGKRRIREKIQFLDFLKLNLLKL